MSGSGTSGTERASGNDSERDPWCARHRLSRARTEFDNNFNNNDNSNNNNIIGFGRSEGINADREGIRSSSRPVWAWWWESLSTIKKSKDKRPPNYRPRASQYYQHIG